MSSETMSKSGSIPVTRLQAFAADALARAGLPADAAARAAELILRSDLAGADGHGIFRLPQYVRRLRAGGINPRPAIRAVSETAAMAVLDGDNGLGHLVMDRATALAVEKARDVGAAWIGVRTSNHAGAASVWAAAMLPHDMIGLYLAVGSANHMAPWGGTDLLLSTNPIAVAVPAGEEAPIVVDMATTVAAYGKVKLAAQRGETMPEGWMIDRQGRPLTDPARSAEGLLVPAGGYKGYALALIFGLLAGTLNDAAFGADVIDFNKDDVSVTNTGQAVLALSLSRFGGVEGFKRRVDLVVRQIRNSARLPGFDQVRVPGENRTALHERRMAEGIPVGPELGAALDKLARDLGLPALSEAP
jgi:L-2-hydroxycarboxylate dehydrogenase (NAD+)